jgi:hypothetical protein
MHVLWMRGWVNYFRVGHSSSCFYLAKRWVEKKVRQHLMRARGRKGFGWTRGSSESLYEQLGLYAATWSIDTLTFDLFGCMLNNMSKVEAR